MKATLKHIGLSVLLSLFGRELKAQTIGFVEENIVKVSGVTTDSAVMQLGISKRQTTRYFIDGLGRTIQAVGLKSGTNNNMDIIQPIVYDTLGRQIKSYLPYVGSDSSGTYRSGAVSSQATYYNTTADKVAHDSSAYSQQVFDNSPLQRVLRAGDIGKGFQPVSGQHYKTIVYRPNTIADSVAKSFPDGSFSGYYTANALSVTDGTDEDGSETLVFKDLMGRVVLKKQWVSGTTYNSTYYIYNNAGTISYVVPPKAWNLIKAHGYTITTAVIARLIFKYVYDYRGRLIEKTVPGAAVMYIVYDPLNRPVLLQDATLKAGNKWNYIKYDAKGRAISQGIYTDTTPADTSRAGMQSYVDGLSGSYSTAWYESRSGTVTNNGYYTNSIFPTSNIAPLAYSYFDDYDLDQNGSADYSYSNQSLSGEAVPTNLTRGMMTMVAKRTVGSGLSDIWLLNVVFYDKRGNTIQQKSNNQLNYTNQTTVTDTKTNVPDFTGKPTITKVTKVSIGPATNTILSAITYDSHNAKVKYIDQTYNAQTAIRVATYQYNEPGQLIKKDLGLVNTASIPATVTLTTGNSVASGQTSNIMASKSILITPDFVAASGSTFTAKIATNYLQDIDYRYTIRGQVQTINNSKLADDGGVTSDEVNDLFGMEYLYNQTDSNLGNTASYSGRISAVKWMSRDNSGNKTNERSYSYAYDNMDRITASTYAERTAASTSSFNLNTNGFNEDGITYDENGNILTLQRNSSTVGTTTHIKVDSLNYTYDTNNPNRLINVTDGSGSNFTSYGFRNLTGSTGNYSYDNEGNLTADPYKGLLLKYNVLNRTDSIKVTTATNRFITYTYDATGIVLEKKQYDNNTLQTTTDYVDGFVYVNGTLSYTPMPEGRVMNISGTLTPEYVITDQQGNARFSFQNDGSGRAKIIQENSYYAFGLVMANSPVSMPSVPNKRLYNGGSEWQNNYGNLPDYFETLYRNYDQSLGRFIGIDPQADGAESLTTYNYSNNNPVSFNDPMGNYYRAMAPPVQDDRGGGGGASSFMNAILAGNAQDQAEIDSWNLETAVRSGDPLAIAQYTAQNGGVTYTVGSQSTNGLSYFYNLSGNLERVMANGSNYTSYQQEEVYYKDQYRTLVDYKLLNSVTDLTLTEVANQGGFVGGDTWNSSSNILTGIGFAGGAASFKLGSDLKRQYDIASAAYEGWHSPQPSILLKTAVGSFGADAKIVKGLSSTLEVGGKVLGGIGVGITVAEIWTGNKKLVGEGGLDLIMGGVGFIPVYGWAISGTYFLGKAALQATGNDFWNH
ncbi:MAG: DUF6443 domain-containing protein [Mucilaginibacter sp.]